MSPRSSSRFRSSWRRPPARSPSRRVDAGDGEALASACRAVCEVLGIEVRPAHTAGKHDQDRSGDRLGELARSSGFHVRPVSLSDGWWRRRGEPMLGRLEDDGTRPWPCCQRAVRWPRTGPPIELREPDGRRPDRRHSASAAEWHGLAGRFIGRSPMARSASSTCLHFCRALPGLGRELGVVLIVAFCGALLGLSIPIASGILVDQVLPEADLPRLAVDVRIPRWSSRSRPPSSRRSRDCSSSASRDGFRPRSSRRSGSVCSGCPAGSTPDIPRATWHSARWG